VYSVTLRSEVEETGLASKLTFSLAVTGNLNIIDCRKKMYFVFVVGPKMNLLEVKLKEV
jgi:hypothetical protein